MATRTTMMQQEQQQQPKQQSTLSQRQSSLETMVPFTLHFHCQHQKQIEKCKITTMTTTGNMCTNAGGLEKKKTQQCDFQQTK